jgi:hypothetical protein
MQIRSALPLFLLFLIWTQCDQSAAAVLPPVLQFAVENYGREMQKDDSGYRTANVEHQLTVRFSTESTAVVTPVGSVRWHFTGYGRGNRMSSQPCSRITAEANRLTYHRGAVNEWYINDERGLEQGFMVAERLSGGEPLVVALSIDEGAVPTLVGDDSVELRHNQNRILRYGGLKAWDARGHTLKSKLEVRMNEIRLVVFDTNAEYPITIDPWVQSTKLTASDGTAGDYAGYSVAANDNTAVVGAYGRNQLAGAAYVHARSGAGWVQQALLTPSDTSPNTYFGISVAVGGDTVLAGASGSNEFQGAAYVFVRHGTTWTQQAKLTASDGAMGDIFGWSVALDGDTAIVGAFAKNNSAGAAYVFKRSGNAWTQQAKLMPADGAPLDYFGWSVALRRNTAIVGAYGQNGNTGAAYAYSRTGEAWTLQEKLVALNGNPNDYFGYSVALEDRLGVVGAFGARGFAGSVYPFKRNGTSWTPQMPLVVGDGIPGDNFGFSVAVRGMTILAGAWGKGGARGAAYLFAPLAGTWNQVMTLSATDGAIGDFYGWSVALAGKTAVIGAYGSLGFRGTGYVFENSCTMDLQLTYSNGSLVIGYTVGAADSGEWSGWLLSPASLVRLWEKSMGPMSTPLTGSSRIQDIPVSGAFGVLAVLTTSAGSQCADLKTISTTGAGVGLDELRAIALKAGPPVP